MSSTDILMDQLFGEDGEQQEPPLDKESNQKNFNKTKRATNNLALINKTSFLEAIREESKTTRETVQKSHDYIREALVSLKKEIVSEVIQKLNPRLTELEELLKEVKNKIAVKNDENESESGSDESEIHEEEIQNEQQQQPENIPPAENERGEVQNRDRAPVNRGGEFVRNNRRGARENRGGRGRARDSRIFYLLRQLENEGFNRAPARERWSPYRENNYSNRNRYGGSSGRR